MTSWQRAITALRLLTMDPIGLGGICVRARVGPARDAFIRQVDKVERASLRLHPAMTSNDLDENIDLTATLNSGSLVMQRGIFDCYPAVLMLPMAERTTPYMSTRLAQVLDSDCGHVLVALDEGVDEDEALPFRLADRLAFQVSLDDIGLHDIEAEDITLQTVPVSSVNIPDDLPETLVVLAIKLGILSPRAATFALKAAKTNAALNGRTFVEEHDVRIAVELVYVHRAKQIPNNEAEETNRPEPLENENEETQQTTLDMIPQDILLEAVKAALPSDILMKLSQSGAAKVAGFGSGQRQIGNRRGRPLPARDTVQKSDARVDLVATLRAALPWQTIRKRTILNHMGAQVRMSDLRHKRYEIQSDRVLIFAVDASGSAAAARLGEAKGAIELLLGQAYARRDHVALISFRGTEAEILLPPTRSLVLTKRRLNALAGGGGTPLAAGLQTAFDMALMSEKKGLLPSVILLTDGRGNIALDGTADRTKAELDAKRVAKGFAARGVDTLILDTGRRPEASLKAVAQILNGHYVALPRANAQNVSKTVSTALEL